VALSVLPDYDSIVAPHQVVLLKTLSSPKKRYSCLSSFMADCELLLRNAVAYNEGVDEPNPGYVLGGAGEPMRRVGPGRHALPSMAQAAVVWHGRVRDYLAKPDVRHQVRARRVCVPRLRACQRRGRTDPCFGTRCPWARLLTALTDGC
jgi:hypothetical protein